MNDNEPGTIWDGPDPEAPFDSTTVAAAHRAQREAEDNALRFRMNDERNQEDMRPRPPAPQRKQHGGGLLGLLQDIFDS